MFAGQSSSHHNFPVSICEFAYEGMHVHNYKIEQTTKVAARHGFGTKENRAQNHSKKKFRVNIATLSQIKVY